MSIILKMKGSFLGATALQPRARRGGISNFIFRPLFEHLVQVACLQQYVYCSRQLLLSWRMCACVCVCVYQRECVCSSMSTARPRTHCNALQRTATHLLNVTNSELVYIASEINIATIHCNTLQHTATHLLDVFNSELINIAAEININIKRVLNTNHVAITLFRLLPPLVHFRQHVPLAHAAHVTYT